jgi:hypothetical protein
MRSLTELHKGIQIALDVSEEATERKRLDKSYGSIAQRYESR